ncbi:MAG TPA: FHA domain-containing protein [Pyrinomonadaceae bacterium]|nr:FHA domain-containing protein [Pyrinomonadaceae bacterium]
MADDQNQQPKRRRDTIMPERIMRRVLEGVGDVVDRKLGRTPDTATGFTTDHLVRRMNALIDERSRNDKRRGRIAPHHLKLKIEWGKHSETPPEMTKRLEHEILAAAIDHINDSRYRTLAPVTIETDVDIFTTGIVVDPTYGEFEEELQQKDLERKLGKDAVKRPKHGDKLNVTINARILTGNASREIALEFVPGGRRLSVGRATDNHLHLNDASVSKIHAALKMDNLGTLMVADTGSTNGTHINGQRIPYGEARPINEGDLVAFGDVEVRFRRIDS